MKRARAIAGQVHTALKIVKSLMKSKDRELVIAQSDAESEYFTTQQRSAELKKAISAFFEKRSVDFSKIA